nr:myb/SANT-like domain, Harbinger transposase-derived nuclease domain protein [Tanacetum cinerariifolium]
MAWRKNSTDFADVRYQSTNTAYPINVYGVLAVDHHHPSRLHHLSRHKRASASEASEASASGASAIRERAGALNMDDDPLVDVAVVNDDDDGNYRAHKILDEVRPKKKAKTSRVIMDDLIMQSALRHIVKTTYRPTTEQCYEKLKLVGLQSMDPMFLATLNIWAIKTDARGVDDIAFGT